MQFPPGAISSRLRVHFERPKTDVAKEDRTHQQVLNRFTLRAFDRSDPSKEVKQFNKPVKITVRYNPRMLPGWKEQDLALVYWDTAKKRWLPLPSAVDVKAHTLTAQTTHFTDFGLSTGSDLQTYLPSLEGFQTDLFTGAAGASYSLEVPPGRGGLAPKLVLEYSSSSVDMMDNDQQASFVGAGWRLGVNYIARDTRGTIQEDDDTFNLVLNGVGYDLLVSGDGYYHTSSEQYWRISYNGAANAWTIITNYGTLYFFGLSDGSRAIQRRWDVNGHGLSEVYMWGLEKIVDTHNNQINFTYLHDTDTVSTCTWGDPSMVTVDKAIYPQRIQYNGGLTQVDFIYSPRQDYNLYYPTYQCGPAPYQTKKLDRVDISTTVAGAMQLVRSYRLAYDYSTFPGVYNNHGDGTGASGRLTLKQMTQYGTDGTSSLPSYTFTYSGNRLLSAENGMGGKVSYAYDSATVTDAPQRWNRYYDYCTAYAACNFGWYGSGAQIDGIPWGSSGLMNVISQSGYAYWDSDRFAPGAAYYFAITVVGIAQDQNVQLRVWDGVAETPITAWYVPPLNSTTSVGGAFTLSDASSGMQLRIYTTSTVSVQSSSLLLYSTHHRVITKTIDDGNGAVGTYAHAYGPFAVNDDIHSEDAKTSNPLHPRGTEFRGHAFVQVTDPAGNKTQNFFFQDDLFKGRAHQIVQLDSSNTKYTRTVNAFDSRCIPTAWRNYSTPAMSNCTRAPTLKPIPFANFDGDRRHDIAAFRPDMGLWGFLQSSSNFSSSSSYAWGIGTDTPVPGDYDGDGKTDIAVYRPSNGTWYILTSSSNFLSSMTFVWGVSTDIPVPGDYDGDGKANIAVFRPSNGTWYIATSASTLTYTLGQSGDIPVPGDYDGDRKTDIAVYRNGVWLILTSSSNFSSTLTYTWGGIDIPVPGDYDGDGKTDLAVYRPGTETWYIATSSSNFSISMTPIIPGIYADIPVPGDYDGDGKADLAVYYSMLHNGLYQVLFSSSGYNTGTTYQFPSAPVGQSNFIYLSSTTRETYDGQATPKSQMTEYTYDAYGNAQWIIEHDNTNAVYRKTLRTFYPNTTPWILNKLALVQVFDGNNVRLAETRYFYDGGANYTTPPIKGDLTRVDATADGTNFFSSATNTFDAYGNLLTTTDALGRTITTSYDTTYNIFPTSVTNALAQTTTNTYDFRLARLSATTDPNGAKTSNAYDVFGRTTDIWLPNEQNYAATVHYDYTLGNPRSQVHVQVRKDLGGANAAAYQHAWWFYDGLGRVIQRQTQGLSNSLILANTAYNNLGQLWRTSNPYSVSAVGGTYQTSLWDSSHPYTEHQYDPIGREFRTVQPDGAATTSVYTIAVNEVDADFNQGGRLAVYVYDANNHITRQSFDAFGNVLTVTEFFTGGEYRTHYAYDRLNRLTDVWDASSNNTHMTYDWLGRKTAMSDPDMGTWSYGYDNVGNPTRQTDAKNQTDCLYYDALNRLKGKNYRGDTACPADPGSGYTVWNKYDEATSTNGKGRRTSIVDPSGSTAWNYDKQGRATSTAKSISGAPAASYATSWTYDAMNRARSMTYPDGEVVPMTYNDQGLLATLGSYVSNSNYNAAGELLSMNLGNGATTSNTYNAQNLRLTQLQTTAGATTLQNLAYAYDNVGNVKTITDTVRSETSTFGYDDLNRLKTASVPGVYSQAWTYGPVGNIASRTDNGVITSYAYTDPAHKHAATQMGSNSYSYDANGNMTYRTENGGNYFQTWDLENRLSAVISDTLSIHMASDGDGQRARKTEYTLQTPLLIDTFDGANTSVWTFSISQTVPFNDGGQNVVKSVGTGVDWNANFYRNANLISGQSASIDFKVDATDTSTHLALESYDGGVYNRWAMIATGNKIFVQYILNVNPLTVIYPQDLINPVKLNTWYRVTLRVDDVNGFKIEVRERDGGTTSGSYSLQMPAGKTWRFHHWIYRNTAYLDNYVERTDSSRTTYYVGNHYEVSTLPTTTTKYYYFGAQRVAMKQGTAVTYLHGDHLGSTSVTSGASSSTQVYYPFGAVRASSGNLQTDFTFTGQKIDASDGLMYYGARYYDAALARFISADTLVPSVYNPQSLNRYAYVRNNPVRYVDPTGHAQTCGQGEVCGEGDTGNVDPPAVTQGEQNPSSGGASNGCSNCQDRPAPPPQTNPVSLDKGIWGLVCKFARALGMDAGCGGGKVGPPGGGGSGGVGTGTIPPSEGQPASKPPSMPGLSAPGSQGRFQSPVSWPGDDPTQAPPGYEWRGATGSEPGDTRGTYHNPVDNRTLYPDVNHPDPIGSHWDFKDEFGQWWRIFPDGTMTPKY